MEKQRQIFVSYTSHFDHRGRVDDFVSSKIWSRPKILKGRLRQTDLLVLTVRWSVLTMGVKRVDSLGAMGAFA